MWAFSKHCKISWRFICSSNISGFKRGVKNNLPCCSRHARDGQDGTGALTNQIKPYSLVISPENILIIVKNISYKYAAAMTELSTDNNFVTFRYIIVKIFSYFLVRATPPRCAVWSPNNCNWKPPVIFVMSSALLCWKLNIKFLTASIYSFFFNWSIDCR